MKNRKRILCALLAFVLAMALPVQVHAASGSGYIRDMINAYRYRQDSAWEEIDNRLDALSAVDAEQGKLWRGIMEAWSRVNHTVIHTQSLPDDLPEDDSLAIVVMGYGLNANGTMRPELRSRLQVAMKSAEKYPNAYIVCTGGGTARYSSNTEAGVMAQWLRDQGVSSQRIITEARAQSTTQNAQYTYRKLVQEYPEVTSIAVVTSDYHMHHSMMMFEMMSRYTAATEGTRELRVVGNACCVTTTSHFDTPNRQAQGIAAIARINLSSASNRSGGQGSAAAPAEQPHEEAPQSQPSSADDFWCMVSSQYGFVDVQ